MKIIQKYFPDLTEKQTELFSQLDSLYREWNDKINVISRKDIDNLYLHHILHSLSIAKIIQFNPGAEIMDLGTGGGLPGIPLAILFPETHFTLLDGTRKKITVVQEIVRALELGNVKGHQKRAEEWKGHRFDFVTCRAVAPLDRLLSWSKPLLKKKETHVFPNGLLALKGGNIRQELKTLPKGEFSEVFPLHDFYEEKYFEEKCLVYVQG
ncbi:MAG: 16S rRNA (guanine(527)-N(7))-methyltransferase RsmG [Bacteroidetes bacterium]|nr:16S rRNA (guanine(527)-N(7))-methyltransferase RsmG [Bacteroidota bacterium]